MTSPPKSPRPRSPPRPARFVSAGSVKESFRRGNSSFNRKADIGGLIEENHMPVKKVPTLLAASLLLVGAGITCAAAKGPSPKQKSLWVGQFNQCSYDALASALKYYYGYVPTYHSRKKFQHRTFFKPLASTGYAPYFGWAPWTSYMVNSGKIIWGHRRVDNLRARRFSLATHMAPKVVNQSWMLVSFRPGERQQLVDRLERNLKKGPVIIWTPYAGILGPKGHAWHMVQKVHPHVYAVPYNVHLTHAITVFPAPHGKVLVTDCSVLHGVYLTTPSVIVDVAAAMSTSIRIGGKHSIYAHGLRGVHDDKFETVIYPKK